MRVARVIRPGTPYHVISRFVDREWYFDGDEDRAAYLRFLQHALRNSDWIWFSYALMSNHIHHGLVAGSRPLGSLLKSAHSAFARWMNERHSRLGPLFAERAASWEIRPANVAKVIAYIHNNPVRAGVVTRASESTWTSHRAYLGACTAPACLNVAEGLARCGLEAVDFDAFVAALGDQDTDPSLDGVRRAARRRGAIEVGTPVKEPLEVPLVGRPFARVFVDPRSVLSCVAALLGLSANEIASRHRAPRFVRARRIVVHGGRCLGLPASDLASVLGLTRQAAARLAAQPLDEIDSAVRVLVCSKLSQVPPSPGKRAEPIGLPPRSG